MVLEMNSDPHTFVFWAASITDDMLSETVDGNDIRGQHYVG